jgi:acyl-coenzyme A thioesterase PaaI-like protein
MPRTSEMDFDTPLKLFVEKHPVAQQLYSSPETTTLRGIYTIPKNIARLNTTDGVLCGPTLLRTAPIVIVNNPQQTVFAAFSLGTDLSGYPGMAHGGLIAMLLDEVMGKASLSVLGHASAFTAKLEVEYLKPVMVDSFAVIIAKMQSVEGRKLWITAVLEGAEQRLVCANAKLLLVKFKEASL